MTSSSSIPDKKTNESKSDRKFRQIIDMVMKASDRVGVVTAFELAAQSLYAQFYNYSNTEYKINICSCTDTQKMAMFINNYLHEKKCESTFQCGCVHCALEILIQTNYLQKIENYLRKPTLAKSFEKANDGAPSDIVCHLLIYKMFNNWPHLMKPFVSSKILFRRLIYILWRDTVLLSKYKQELQKHELQKHNATHPEMKITSWKIVMYHVYLKQFMIKCNKTKHIRWFFADERMQTNNDALHCNVQRKV